MSDPLNIYGDEFRPTDNGYGVDIASQRQDELDLQSLAFIAARTVAGLKTSAVDLGGGFGVHAIRMAAAGAAVTMIDRCDTATENFKAAIAEKFVPPDSLHFIVRDFSQLADDDIPDPFDLLYSQRAIHYVPYRTAEKVLSQIFQRMSRGGAVFLSAAGYDTEYGQTHPNRAKPVEERFGSVAPDMQKKHGIMQDIVIYTEQDMRALLQATHFEDIHVTRSAFGNIKATAYKP